jgi:hypothetical protein
LHRPLQACSGQLYGKAVRRVPVGTAPFLLTSELVARAGNTQCGDDPLERSEARQRPQSGADWHPDRPDHPAKVSPTRSERYGLAPPRSTPTGGSVARPTLYR